jgi:RNA polymerase sigma-70 factor (family 1)
MPAYHLLDDLQLIDRLKNDDRKAFAEIYQRYAAQLTKFTSAKIDHFEDASDLIHDLFVKFWEQRKNLQIDHDLKAYLFSIARYRIIDKIRKNSTREAYAARIQALGIRYESVIEQKLDASEMQKRIDHSLNQLSPRIKQIYHMSREENLSIPEIAKKLEISPQTVKNQLSSALKRLRETLAIVRILLF